MPDALRTRRRLAGTVADLGFRRIEQVRVIVGCGPAVAEVTGVTHRYPRTMRVSLASAAQLAGAGVPLHVEHRRGASSRWGGR